MFVSTHNSSFCTLHPHRRTLLVAGSVRCLLQRTMVSWTSWSSLTWYQHSTQRWALSMATAIHYHFHRVPFKWELCTPSECLVSLYPACHAHTPHTLYCHAHTLCCHAHTHTHTRCTITPPSHTHTHTDLDGDGIISRKDLDKLLDLLTGSTSSKEEGEREENEMWRQTKQITIDGVSCYWAFYYKLPRYEVYTILSISWNHLFGLEKEIVIGYTCSVSLYCSLVDCGYMYV